MIEQLAKQLFNDLHSKLEGGDAPLDASRLKVLIESALRKLNLVSREEFDAQAAVLQRTRAKLDELEKLLNTLDKTKR